MTARRADIAVSRSARSGSRERRSQSHDDMSFLWVASSIALITTPTTGTAASRIAAKRSSGSDAPPADRRSFLWKSFAPGNAVASPRFSSSPIPERTSPQNNEVRETLVSDGNAATTGCRAWVDAGTHSTRPNRATSDASAVAMALLIPSSTTRSAPPWRRQGLTISASSRSAPTARWVACGVDLVQSAMPRRGHAAFDERAPCRAAVGMPP